MKKTVIRLSLFTLFAVTNFFAYSQNLVWKQNAVELLTKECENSVFFGSVVIAHNDSVIFSRSCGYADFEKQILNDSNTKFNIASCGKLFTQVVILQLIQEGKIRLTDTIGKFFTGFTQPDAAKISIFHLLNHSAGLGDVLSTREYEKLSDFTETDKIVMLISREKLAFVPGEKSEYSNSGYYLLGAIAAKVDGKKFEEVVRARIFAPLQMLNSGFTASGTLVANHALPYRKRRNNLIQIKPGLIGDCPSGAGGEYSTASDLFKFWKSIATDNIVLTDDSKSLLFNHYAPIPWNEILRSGKLYGQAGGDTRGWSAKLTFLFLEKGVFGTVILSNFDNMAHELDLKIRPSLKSY